MSQIHPKRDNKHDVAWKIFSDLVIIVRVTTIGFRKYLYRMFRTWSVFIKSFRPLPVRIRNETRIYTVKFRFIDHLEMLVDRTSGGWGSDLIAIQKIVADDNWITFSAELCSSCADFPCKRVRTEQTTVSIIPKIFTRKLVGFLSNRIRNSFDGNRFNLQL